MPCSLADLQPKKNTYTLPKKREKESSIYVCAPISFYLKKKEIN